MGRPKGSKNKPKETKGYLEAKEKKSSLEHEIVIHKKNAQRRARKGAQPKITNLIKDYDKENTEPPKGNQEAICKNCGKKFNQNFSEDRNAYSSFRTCPECRAKRSAKQEKKIDESGEREVAVATLPYKPFPAQQRIHEAFEDHRFIVIDAGNRFGKDRCSIMIGIKYFIECLNENRLIEDPDMVPSVLWWIIAPTEPMAQQNWRELNQYFPKQWVVAVSNSDYQMETIGGGIIQVRSGYDPEALVGVGLDLITLTEAARFRDLSTAWANLEARLNSPKRGRKKDRMGSKAGMGKGIINSSPIGKNYFYTMWTWGQQDNENYDSLWWSCQCPWTDNPDNLEQSEKIVKTKYGDITYAESLRRRHGDRLYRQNYLGDFLADDSSVFKGFEEKCIVNLFSNELNLNEAGRNKYKQEWEKVLPMRVYVGGYDPATGSSSDNPWFVVRDTETNNVVLNVNLYGLSYEQQISKIATYCKKYNYAALYWLRTGHTALEGKFAEQGIEEIPLDEQGGHKAQLVQTLELAVENGDIHVLMDGTDEAYTMISQMNDYTQSTTLGGNPKYSNNQVPHDDAVSALYAAWSSYKVFDILPVYFGKMSGNT